MSINPMKLPVAFGAGKLIGDTFSRGQSPLGRATWQEGTGRWREFLP